MNSLSKKIPRHDKGMPINWGNVAVFITVLVIAAIGLADSRNDVLTSFRHLNLNLAEIIRPTPTRDLRLAAIEKEPQTATEPHGLSPTLEQVASVKETAPTDAAQPISVNEIEESTGSIQAPVVEDIAPTKIAPTVAQTKLPEPATSIIENIEPESVTEGELETASSANTQTVLEEALGPSGQSNWNTSIITGTVDQAPVTPSEEVKKEAPLIEQTEIEEIAATEAVDDKEPVAESTEIMAVAEIEEINRLEPPAAARPEVTIHNAVISWAAAWSNQDVNAYLDHYATNFTPSRKMNRSAWEKQRRERLQRPASINVQLSDIEITLTEDGSASATFAQTYKSPRYSDQVRKRLSLVQEEDGWKISLEESL